MMAAVRCWTGTDARRETLVCPTEQEAAKAFGDIKHIFKQLGDTLTE